MALQKNEQFWREFIEIYRCFPELWKTNCEFYKNRLVKSKAYAVLLNKLKEVEPTATVDVVKRKINSLRSCYRRELRKVKSNKLSADGTHEVYTPTLWYFDELEFLREQEEKAEDISIMEIDGIESSSGPEFESSLNAMHDNRRKKELPQKQKVKTVQHLARRAIDDATIFSATWETLFRKLSPEQQFFANKAILEVLYQGALDNLNEHIYKAFENQLQHAHHTQETAGATAGSASYTSSQLYSDDSAYDASPYRDAPNGGKSVVASRSVFPKRTPSGCMSARNAGMAYAANLPQPAAAIDLTASESKNLQQIHNSFNYF